MCNHSPTPSLTTSADTQMQTDTQRSLFSQHLPTRWRTDAHVKRERTPLPSGLSASAGKDCNLNPSPPRSNINSGGVLKDKPKCSARPTPNTPSPPACCCETPHPAERPPSPRPHPCLPLAPAPSGSPEAQSPHVPRRSSDLGMSIQRVHQGQYRTLGEAVLKPCPPSQPDVALNH